MYLFETTTATVHALTSHFFYGKYKNRSIYANISIILQSVVFFKCERRMFTKKANVTVRTIRSFYANRFCS